MKKLTATDYEAAISLYAGNKLTVAISSFSGYPFSKLLENFREASSLEKDNIDATTAIQSVRSRVFSYPHFHYLSRVTSIHSEIERLISKIVLSIWQIKKPPHNLPGCFEPSDYFSNSVENAYIKISALQDRVMLLICVLFGVNPELKKSHDKFEKYIKSKIPKFFDAYKQFSDSLRPFKDSRNEFVHDGSYDDQLITALKCNLMPDSLGDKAVEKIKNWHMERKAKETYDEFMNCLQKMTVVMSMSETICKVAYEGALENYESQL